MRPLHHLLHLLHIPVRHGEELIVFTCLVLMLLGLALCFGIALVVFFQASAGRPSVPVSRGTGDSDPSLETAEAGVELAHHQGHPLLRLVPPSGPAERDARSARRTDHRAG